jgi:hypothetical protein
LISVEKLKHNNLNKYKIITILKLNIVIQLDYPICIKINKNIHNKITMMIEFLIMLNIKIYNNISEININLIWLPPKNNHPSPTTPPHQTINNPNK